MRDYRYELVIVWATGETDIIKCETEEDAEQVSRNMKMAFGNQVSWTGVRESR